jgi:CRP/FNR family cyclic AMP-dependent transcriptional regulator
MHDHPIRPRSDNPGGSQAGASRRMSKQEAEQILLSRGWLRFVSARFQQDVLSRSSLREYEPREIIFRQGEEGGGMFGMIAGSVCISLAPNMRGPYAASFVRPGTWFGGGPAITDEPRQVGATARLKTVLMHLPLAAIREITTAHPTFWRYLAVNVSLNLKAALQCYDDLLIADPRMRVAAILLRLAGYDKDPADPFADPEIPMTQTEIAEITRLTRNGLGGILTRLAREGLVSMGYRHITITGPAGLIRIVHEGH